MRRVGVGLRKPGAHPGTRGTQLSIPVALSFIYIWLDRRPAIHCATRGPIYICTAWVLGCESRGPIRAPGGRSSASSWSFLYTSAYLFRSFVFACCVSFDMVVPVPVLSGRTPEGTTRGGVRVRTIGHTTCLYAACLVSMLDPCISVAPFTGSSRM